jgi:regulator of nonsense transcripts 2
VKYLGELYVHHVVDSRVIFDTLWSLVTFGHRASLVTRFPIRSPLIFDVL